MQALNTSRLKKLTGQKGVKNIKGKADGPKKNLKGRRYKRCNNHHRDKVLKKKGGC